MSGSQSEYEENTKFIRHQSLKNMFTFPKKKKKINDGVFPNKYSDGNSDGRNVGKKRRASKRVMERKKARENTNNL